MHSEHREVPLPPLPEAARGRHEGRQDVRSPVTSARVRHRLLAYLAGNMLVLAGVLIVIVVAVMQPVPSFVLVVAILMALGSPVLLLEAADCVYLLRHGPES